MASGLEAQENSEKLWALPSTEGNWKVLLSLLLTSWVGTRAVLYSHWGTAANPKDVGRRTIQRNLEV